MICKVCGDDADIEIVGEDFGLCYADTEWMAAGLVGCRLGEVVTHAAGGALGL